jgi:very-short-patch-repair endonuclease
MNRMGTKGAKPRPDALAARIAGRQHGVISAAQLLAAGLSRRAIQVRLQTGRLHRVFRGVYAVGHGNLTHQGRSMAAVLACGDSALLSHRSAAMLWGLLKGKEGAVDVTVPGIGGRKRRQGIRVHRSTSLTPKAATIRQGIPTTTPARTILDLRRVADRRILEDAVGEAEIRRLPIGRLPGLLHEPTRSRLERRFLRLCKRHALAKPEVNFEIGPYEVDFLWPDRKLIVETDGWESHGTPSAFEADRARDAYLESLGYRVVRFTYRQVWHDGAVVAQRLRALLGVSRASS